MSRKGETRAYFTAKDINATSGSRNAFAVNIAVGMVLQEDPHRHEGLGLTLAQPTSVIKTGLWVVTELVTATGQTAGWIWARRAHGRQACLINGATTAGVTQMQVNAATGRLIAAAPTTVAHLLVSVGAQNAAAPCGVAMQTNASGDATIFVDFGSGLGGVSAAPA